MTGEIELSVIVVSHNGADWLGRCLGAIVGEGRPSVPFEVLVLDNASDEPARRVLQGSATAAPEISVTLLDRNVGFGRACNLAVKESRGRRILLLNPDAVVLPGCVDALLAFLDARPQAGIVGGRTLRPDGTTDPSSCWGAASLWSTACFALGLSTLFKRNPVLDPESLGHWDRDCVREVDIVTGCLLLTSRAVWEELGGFDETFFMYGEDADLSLRAAQLGYRPAITPDAVAVHAVGASSSTRTGKLRLLLTGKATLMVKHWSRRRRIAGVALLQCGVGLRAVGQRSRGSAQATWPALWRERRTWRQGWGGDALGQWR